MMKQVYQKRAQAHQKKMMRYLKYVFNDHFMLVCLFLLGGLSYSYSEAVKNVSTDFFWGKWLIATVFLLSLFLGKMATLAEEADKVFLLPKEREMPRYLQQAFKHSIGLPLLICFFVSGASMPLLIAVSGWTYAMFPFYFVLLLLLKISNLMVQTREVFQEIQLARQKSFGIWLIGSMISIFSSVFWVPWLGVLVALFLVVYQYQLLNQTFREATIDWEKMIKLEQARLRKIYQFIHLFTDVPGISTNVKRRKWLDFLVQPIKKNHANTYFYLYSRSFLRGTEYSGLFLRLVMIAAVIVLFLPEFWVALGIMCLFLYLIGFQLLPLYTQFDYMVMTRLYPVTLQQKKVAVEKLVGYLLSMAGIVFIVVSTIALKSMAYFGIISATFVIEIFLFVKIYLPYRLRKLA